MKYTTSDSYVFKQKGAVIADWSDDACTAVVTL